MTLGFERHYWALAISVLAASGPGLSAARAEDPKGPPPEPSIASVIGNDPLRAPLAGIGVTYGANYIGEAFSVSAGGLSRGGSFNGRVEAYADVDLEKLAGWKGATFHINAYYIHGDGPTSKRIGNIFAVSNVEALETVRLFEYWIEQTLLEDKMSVRFGNLAADSEFFASETAGQFFNGTFGWPGITAANMPQGGPAYPLATPGVRVQYAPNDALTIRAAVFNGFPADPLAADPQRANRHGTDFRIDDEPLVMAEAEFKYTLGHEGTLKLGGWNHLAEFSDLRAGAPVNGSHGLYAIVDQQIWKGSGEESARVFARISGSPDRQNLIDFYFDAGVVFSGLIASRPEDTFGAAFGYGRIGDASRAADRDAGLPVVRDHEAVLEINYTAAIAPGWTVTPDFQYIWHPGGHVEDPLRPGLPVEDTAVFGVRTSVNY